MNNQSTLPIILLGFQRSGTTVFAHKLSEAFGVDNGMFSVNGKLMYYLHRWLTMKDIGYRHLRVDEILFSLKRRVPGGIGVERYLYQVEKVLREVAIDVAEGYQGNELELGRRIVSESYKGFTRWGDKYNEYLQIFPYLNNVVPDAKYILMFRDPYDVASSVMEWEGDRPWRPISVTGNLKSGFHGMPKLLSRLLLYQRNVILLLNISVFVKALKTIGFLILLESI